MGPADSEAEVTAGEVRPQFLFDVRRDGLLGDCPILEADSALPTTDRSEAQFRALFLQQLALKISRSFHAYESRDVFASDNHVL